MSILLPGNYYETIIIIFMQKTILQVPLSQNLKINAKNAAHEHGFSSLQEIVRVFLA